ncbi:MAG: radical SAM protein [Deltaproteobacteria bacterium]|nr:radical SAM protein [Deltaproteobacteria bacterium]
MNPKPRHASVAVLDRCDAKCIMCNIWQEHRRDEVSLAYFETLPTTLRTINVTGGEPFMREDLPEVIRTIDKRCNRPRMIISSNGFNTKKIGEAMEKIRTISHRVGVRISIDGHESMHDTVRGVPGAFKKCMKTIEVLKTIGVTDLGLSFTISPVNLGDLIKVYHLTRRLGIQFTLTIAQNSEFYFKTKANDFELDPKALTRQFNELLSMELKSLHPKRWFRAYYDKGVYDYGMGKRVLKNCSAASGFFFSSARGEIYPCPILDKKLGNAAEEGFEQVWNSKEAEAVRTIARDCPTKCWMTCTVGPHFKQNFGSILGWIFQNKVRAHLGLSIL